MSARPIRVLIVDDVPESRDNVEKLLRFEPDIHVVAKASRGREGIDLAVEHQPDIVLMDLNMPDMDGIQATMELTTKVPTAAVIMMSVQNESDVLRRAMLAGAREFLAKPFSLDELISAVRHVSRLAAQTQRVVVAPTQDQNGHTGSDEAQGQVISVCSSKGGVGRSFVASNLAVALLRAMNKRVVLVDANMEFGDIGVMLNVVGAKTMADVVPLVSSLDPELLENLLGTHASGVQFLLAPPTPQDSETVTADHLRTTLSVLARMFDYVVIDTRPGFDDKMLTILDLSDIVLLVFTMEMTSIKDTRQFLEISDLLGYPENKIQLVLNRLNNYSGIPVEDISENLGRELPFRIPEEPTAILRSINEGSPLVESQPNHRVALEVAKLASALSGTSAQQPSVVAQPVAQERSDGFVSRLRTAFRQP